MQSIAADGIDDATGASPAAARPRRRLAGIVLPRFLRRPARMLEKATWRVPRYVGTGGVALFYVATVLAGVVIGGHASDVVAALTTWAGLGIEQVRITGQSRTEELDVLHKLDIGAFPSLVTFDLDAAKARVETLPWVAEASLRKLYPHDLAVVIRERQPYALWQDGDNKLWLIDDQGHRITDVIDPGYTRLPLVVGEGAAERIAEFTALLAGVPTIAPHARAGILIGGRRWTVVLDSGVELMLPEDKPAIALATLARLDSASALLSRAITAVDLRAGSQAVVRLDADGQAARAALLKARAKAPKAKF